MIQKLKGKIKEFLLGVLTLFIGLVLGRQFKKVMCSCPRFSRSKDCYVHGDSKINEEGDG